MWADSLLIAIMKYEAKLKPKFKDHKQTEGGSVWQWGFQWWEAIYCLVMPIHNHNNDIISLPIHPENSWFSLKPWRGIGLNP